MSLTEDGGVEQHRKRSTALQTFEVVSGLESKLTRLIAQFEGLAETVKKWDEESDGLEARLRGLESRVTVIETASGTSRGTWGAVWLGVIAVATLLVSITNILVQLLHPAAAHAP